MIHVQFLVQSSEIIECCHEEVEWKVSNRLTCNRSVHFRENKEKFLIVDGLRRPSLTDVMAIFTFHYPTFFRLFSDTSIDVHCPVGTGPVLPGR